MAWTSVLETDPLTLVVDEEKGTAIFETGSGGYRPRYVTLHLDANRLDEPVSAVGRARQLIRPDNG